MKKNEIDQLLGDFLEYLELNLNRAPKTIENYQHYLERFFTFSQIKSPQEITLEKVPSTS